MNRVEFMSQLERLLMDIPEIERSDAIMYYNDYFDEAGPEKESQIIQELGSPGKVAATIKASMRSNAYRGEYTSTGYQDTTTRETPLSPAERYHNTTNRKGVGAWILIVIAAIFAAPIILGIGGGLFGLLFGTLGTLFGILISVLVGGIGLLIGGIAGIAGGIIACFTHPATGILILGGGMLSFSLSILFISAGIWCIFRVVPRLFRGIADALSRVLHRKNGGHQA